MDMGGLGIWPGLVVHGPVQETRLATAPQQDIQLSFIEGK